MIFSPEARLSLQTEPVNGTAHLMRKECQTVQQAVQQRRVFFGSPSPVEHFPSGNY